MLLIAVDVLEAFMLYEVVLDGKVIFRSRDDTICNVDPPFCNLPAGGKLSPKKRVEKKKRRRKKVRIKEMKERKNGRKNEKKKEEMKEIEEERRKKERIKKHLFHFKLFFKHL